MGQDLNTKADKEAQWQQRLEELQHLRAAGGDWPRHQKLDDKHERTLRVWLHRQRIDYRTGRLNPVKEKKLNTDVPGWRDGRGRKGAAAIPNQKPSNPDSDQL